MTETKAKLLIDVRELSELTGIDSGTLYRWASLGKVPCIRLSARCLRFSVPAIQKWLDELSEPPAKART